jgi:hypothetical protein
VVPGAGVDLNWGTGELGNWGTGELGNWGTGELGNWGTGEVRLSVGRRSRLLRLLPSRTTYHKNP